MYEILGCKLQLVQTSGKMVVVGVGQEVSFLKGLSKQELIQLAGALEPCPVQGVRVCGARSVV